MNNLASELSEVKRVLRVPDVQDGEPRQLRVGPMGNCRKAGDTVIVEGLRQRGRTPYASSEEAELVDRYWPGCLTPSTSNEFTDEEMDDLRRRVFLAHLGRLAAERLQEEGVIAENASEHAVAVSISQTLRDEIDRAEALL